MTSCKPDNALFGLGGIRPRRDPSITELFTPKEDPSEIVDDPLQKLIKKREEGLKDRKNRMRYGSLTKNAKKFYRMNGYRNDGANNPLGGLRIIYEPPLRDSYSDVVFPVISFCSLALENYNKREGTNYKYVGLLKACFWNTSSTSHSYEIIFTASEALVSDFEDVRFQTQVCCNAHEGKLVPVIEQVSKCSPSTHS